tara:strand:+ start:2359 stop:2469 length:111 start_codon:yes stop_codon:yes gene_type:complete
MKVLDPFEVIGAEAPAGLVYDEGFDMFVFVMRRNCF